MLRGGRRVRTAGARTAARAVMLLVLARHARSVAQPRGSRAGVERPCELDDHFSGVYGQRWPALRRALEAPPQQVCWHNPFVSSDWEAGGLRVRHAPSNATFFVRELAQNQSSPSAAGTEWPAPMPVGLAGRGGHHLFSHYLMDGASPLPALALAPRPGERVLDLCAAPGGKSLVLASQLFAAGGKGTSASRLECNDKSQARASRLRQVCRKTTVRVQPTVAP